MQMRVLPRSRVLAALVFAAVPASAQVTPYGSGINPPGSLAVLSGTPELGGTLLLGIQNTAVSDAGLSLALLSFATAPAPGFPGGVVLPGLGLSEPGGLGELLLSAVPPNPLVTIGPVFWFGGASAPAEFAVAIPVIPSLQGASIYTQGALVALTQGNAIGLTNGLRLRIQKPEPDPTRFAPVPAGSFQMGSDAAGGAPYFGSADTQPVHQVTISKPFWMGRYEVTQAEYQALVGSNPSEFQSPDRPIERVNWFQAVNYCNALNAQQTALGKVPAGYQYRLPTEAEWEYACRAGTTTEFHYGPALLCNEARFSYSHHSTPPASCGNPPGTVPVGSYAPNAWGLYDMHGNVREWCLDSFSDYTVSAKTDPFNSVGPFRTTRGGCWNCITYDCRSAFRYPGAYPEFFSSNYGFRVVLAPILVP